MDYTLYGFIALGGAIGALSRYLLSTWVGRGHTFPWGTFVVNVLGCFLLGLIYVWGTEKLMISPNMRAFLAIGILGAFTTFSTFSVETLNIIKEGALKMALLNIVGSVMVGLFAVWVGMVCAQWLSK